MSWRTHPFASISYVNLLLYVFRLVLLLGAIALESITFALPVRIERQEPQTTIHDPRAPVAGLQGLRNRLANNVGRLEDVQLRRLRVHYAT